MSHYWVFSEIIYIQEYDVALALANSGNLPIWIDVIDFEVRFVESDCASSLLVIGVFNIADRLARENM
jgi:hypothetical protein